MRAGAFSGLIVVAAVSLLALLGAMAPRAYADRDQFVGSAACGSCHLAAATVHAQSAHARAGQAVSADRLRRCDRCHRTGDAPLGDSYFDEVGCEACHGAGAGYATDDIMRDVRLARLLGLRDLSTREAQKALCLSCHQEPSTRRLPFDFDSAYKRIEHP